MSFVHDGIFYSKLCIVIFLMHRFLSLSSVKEAFTFGEEYVKAVTASNPPPVQIKLEKVYAACLMQTVRRLSSVDY